MRRLPKAPKNRFNFYKMTGLKFENWHAAYGMHTPYKLHNANFAILLNLTVFLPDTEPANWATLTFWVSFRLKHVQITFR